MQTRRISDEDMQHLQSFPDERKADIEQKIMSGKPVHSVVLNRDDGFENMVAREHAMLTEPTMVIAMLVGASIAFALASSSAHTQEKFPNKPIRLVLANVAGGAPDAVARMMGQKLSESWKQPVVVDNRVGGGGTLAALQVAKATPDGHTLLYPGATFVISAVLQTTLPYDPLKDFAGVAQTSIAAQVFVVAPALGVKSVKELIALSKGQPGKIVFGSTQVGTSTHLIGVRFSLAADIKVVTVAFKGGPEAIIQLLGGRTHYSVVSLFAGLPFIKDGRLLALAVSTPERSPALPDVPALAETMPEVKRPEVSSGLLAPAGTPRHIVNQISKEVGRILALPDIKEKLLGLGVVPAPTTPEEYDKILREQIAILSKLAKDIGLKAKRGDA